MIILGLGCNIGDRLLNLRQALHKLHNLKNLQVIQVSPLYESDALLPDNAPDNWDQPYLNVAIGCQSKLSPDALLTELKNIELQMGRTEQLRWAPRIIDIDILAWDDKIYQSDTLQIPHPELLNRSFALWPLLDLAPNSYSCTRDTRFHTRQIAHRIDTPQMVGVLNITPDSFSDGGQYKTIDAVVKQAHHLYTSGADIIDIGAESTRPGATTIITPEQEWQRLDPVLKAITTTNLNFKLSLDSRNPSTVRRVLEKYKIDWLNDQTGFDNPEMRKIATESSVKLVIMHHLSIPEDRNVLLSFSQDTIAQVYQWAKKRIAELRALGIDKERLIFDPGIGFGKHAEQSLEIIKRTSEFKTLDVPLLIGHSRKSFLNQFTDRPFAERDLETAVISNFLSNQVDYLRVHNVDAQMRALKIHKALYAD